MRVLIVFFYSTIAFMNSSLQAAEQKTGCFHKILKLSHREFHFIVYGRTPLEKKIKFEEEALQNGLDSDLAIVEWIYHPFYVPEGHVSLRIGKAVFEFAPRGWRVHEVGEDNARSFLVNNPFFRESYKKNKGDMPPFSVGIPIQTTRAVALKIVQWIRDYEKNEGPRFRYFSNNCNHSVINALLLNGVSRLPTFTGLEAFSSELSTRRLLLDVYQREMAISIYPLAGHTQDSVLLDERFPRYLVEETSVLNDLFRLFVNTSKIHSFYDSFRMLMRINP